MTITPATVECADEIARVHIRSWQAAYTGILDQEFLDTLGVEERAQRWRGILERAESQTLVARESDRVVGFISFGQSREKEPAPNQGEIWALYADPDVWGQGIGCALIKQAMAGLRTLGYTDISLQVLTQNERGIRFYRAFGFLPVPGSETYCELGGRSLEEVRFRLRPDW
jgi:ribosomal protein S18 acetylase RimI-like enzyme